MGTGGFLVFDATGTCKVAQAKWYGDAQATNNKAETQALLDLMEWLAAN